MSVEQPITDNKFFSGDHGSSQVMRRFPKDCSREMNATCWGSGEVVQIKWFLSPAVDCDMLMTMMCNTMKLLSTNRSNNKKKVHTHNGTDLPCLSTSYSYCQLQYLPNTRNLNRYLTIPLSIQATLWPWLWCPITEWPRTLLTHIICHCWKRTMSTT